MASVPNAMTVAHTPNPCSIHSWVIDVETVDVSFACSMSAAVLDWSRNRILIWGGDGQSSLSAWLRSWRISEQGLHPVAGAGGARPTGTIVPAMALDTTRDVLYVFGGWPPGGQGPVDDLFQIDVNSQCPGWECVTRSEPWPCGAMGPGWCMIPVGNACCCFPATGAAAIADLGP